jgi:hypothetical protein
MKVRLSQLLQPSVRQGLKEAGLEVVEIGTVPYWMERVVSIPAEVYRMKAEEQEQ